MGLFPERMFEGTNWRRKHGEPKNRRQLFQCVFTDQFFSLIMANLLYLLFWLPTIVWTVICVSQIMISAQAEDGAATLATINTWTLGLIPCLTLLGPARAGMALLMRNWAREDYTKIIPTFFKGLQQNWKQTLPAAFLSGLLPMALWAAYQMSAQGSNVLLIVVCVAAVLYLLVMQVYYVLLVTYDLRPMQHFRNAVLLSVMKLPTFLLIFLGSSFVLIISIVFSLLYQGDGYINLLIPLVYYSVIGFAATELANASLANKLCDDYFSREDDENKGDQVRTEGTF